MLINSLLYKETIWQKNCGDKIEFPLTGCGSRWGLLIFITGTLWRPSQLGTERNQCQLKENGKVALTMGFNKKVVFLQPCCINVSILYLWIAVQWSYISAVYSCVIGMLQCAAGFTSKEQKTNLLSKILFRFRSDILTGDNFQERYHYMCPEILRQCTLLIMTSICCACEALPFKHCWAWK